MRPREVASRTQAGRERKPKESLSQWTAHNKKDGTSEEMRQEGPAPPEVHEMKASREEGEMPEQNLFWNLRMTLQKRAETKSVLTFSLSNVICSGRDVRQAGIYGQPG